jgi:hypothetical protein
VLRVASHDLRRLDLHPVSGFSTTISASVVFTFGHLNSTGGPAAPAPTGSPSQVASRPSVGMGLRVQPLGSAVTVSSQGAEIVEIAPNSAAALVNITSAI